MPDGIIGMNDMSVIFSVTDLLGINRESVRVDLSKEDPGAVGRDAEGMIAITVPEHGAVEEFAATLRTALEGMGYRPLEEESGE
ncbi:MAG: hypothetical protein EXR54_09405 [Dehalococcoidia bacterium]|nr:hypothetical protein [Dehalococcoidia bacterium]MSQ17755.1 hypothetical protein [Dehalococcoidia bacterium]